MGTFYSRVNKWKTTQLTVDHKPNNPNESKRIMSFNGRVDRYKNEFGEEYGPYRVFGKDDFAYPALSISRTIGDLDAKKWGVVYEPELFKYELKELVGFNLILLVSRMISWPHTAKRCHKFIPIFFNPQHFSTKTNLEMPTFHIIYKKKK